MIDLRLAVSSHVSGSSPAKVRCPVHDDPSASMAVYSDHIHCFGCGFHRNDADEALAVLMGVEKHEAKPLLARFEAGEVTPTQAVPAGPLPVALATMYHSFLMSSPRRSHRMSWLLERGLTGNTIAKAQLGHDGVRFTIPVYSYDGELLTIRYRSDPMYDRKFHEDDTLGRKYMGTKDRNEVYLYGAQWLTPDLEEVVVCEGELDALSVAQAGRPAVSATNGARQAFRALPLAAGLLPRLRRAVVATDADDAGRRAAEEVARAAVALGIQATRWIWWDCKDIGEHLLLHRGVLNVLERTWDGRGFNGQ